MKNSHLARFQPRREPPKPPQNLGKSGRALWRAVQGEYVIDDPGGQAHLLAACRAEDDLVQMRAQVAVEGFTLTDRFGQLREHPLLAAIRGLEAVRRQSLRALNLDVEPLRENK